MTNSIVIENQKQKIRLFPGEDTLLSFTFENTSIFPLINGELRFEHGPAIQPSEQKDESKNLWNKMKTPATIFGEKKDHHRNPYDCQTTWYNENS